MSLSVLVRSLLALALSLVCLTSPARAQSCHAPSLRNSDDGSYRVGVGALFASYESSSFTGEYQGVLARAAYVHPRVELDLSLPYYRLVRNGLAQHGVGDLALDARVIAFRSDDGSVAVGPELALTLPTGDADRSLGMGHVMLMPGAWLRLQHMQLTLIAQLAYGRSASSTSMGSHQHGGYFPIVNPMNMQEIEHALSLGYALHRLVELEARVLGAVPVASPGGSVREILAGGVRVNAGIIDVGVEVQVPVMGSPFQTRTLLSAAAQW